MPRATMALALAAFVLVLVSGEQEGLVTRSHSALRRKFYCHNCRRKKDDDFGKPCYLANKGKGNCCCGTKGPMGNKFKKDFDSSCCETPRQKRAREKKEKDELSSRTRAQKAAKKEKAAAGPRSERERRSSHPAMSEAAKKEKAAAGPQSERERRSSHPAMSEEDLKVLVSQLPAKGTLPRGSDRADKKFKGWANAAIAKLDANQIDRDDDLFANIIKNAATENADRLDPEKRSLLNPEKRDGKRGHGLSSPPMPHELRAFVRTYISGLAKCWKQCRNAKWADGCAAAEDKPCLTDFIIPMFKFYQKFGVVFWTGGATGVAQAEAAQLATILSKDPEDTYITLEGSLLGFVLDRVTNADRSRMMHVNCEAFLGTYRQPTTTPQKAHLNIQRSHLALEAGCHNFAYNRWSSNQRREKMFKALGLKERQRSEFDQTWLQVMSDRVFYQQKKPHEVCYQLTLGYDSNCGKIGDGDFGLWGAVSKELAKHQDMSKVVFTVQRSPKLDSYFWNPGGELNALKQGLTKDKEATVVVIRTSPGCDLEAFYEVNGPEKFKCQMQMPDFVKEWATGNHYKANWGAPTSDMVMLEKYRTGDWESDKKGSGKKAGIWYDVKGKFKVCSLKEDVKPGKDGHGKSWGVEKGLPKKKTIEWKIWKDMIEEARVRWKQVPATAKLAGSKADDLPSELDTVSPKDSFGAAPYPLAAGKWPSDDTLKKMKRGDLDGSKFECLEHK